MFQYFYFGRRGDFARFFARDYTLKLLFYFYTPLVLIFSFFKVAEIFGRLGRIAVFSCTLLGMITVEMTVFNSVRRLSAFDLIYHGFIIIQLALITRVFVRGLLKKLDLDNNLKMNLDPDIRTNIVVVIWVVIVTLILAVFTKLKPYRITELTLLGGNGLIWLIHFWRERQLRPKKAKVERSPPRYRKK